MQEIKRVFTTHTINSVALSVIGIYIPAYLLTLGHSLSQVILFYVITHAVGLIYALLIFPWVVQRWGLLNAFKLNFPLQIAYLVFLSLLKTYPISIEFIAVLNGLGLFAYWIPINILLIRHSKSEIMGSNMSWFFALPNIFGILGPIISSVLIPFVGFWPVFCISIVGLLISYIPLVPVNDSDLRIKLNFSSVIRRLLRNKTVFLFEFLENIIEESEWFWSIYVFLIIGSLTAPGIVGSCQAIGGSLFTLIIGHYVNKKGKQLIPLASLLLLVVFLFKIVSWTPLTAYIVTVAGSFMLSLFVVSYYSAIYRTVKNDDEEEFMVVREISTVAGRMVVFGAMFLLQQHLRYFFILPIFVTLLLLFLYKLKNTHLKS